MSRIEDVDPQVAGIIANERTRQRNTIELIASENHASPAVLEAMGSVMTDKYAEGYPGRRYYCGNENMDAVEQLAIDRAKELFGCEHANVQPHSGTSANIACYMAALNPGDKIMGMALAHGGHLSHGLSINFSGKLYEVVSYGVEDDTETLDMNHVRDAALKERPKMIIAGASAYSRTIDFEAFGKIADEVGAVLLSDMAHIAGLVAAGMHPSPVPHSALVTTTTHKTLRGPRGGVVLCREDWAKKINSAVFPGIQGGPIMQNIAAKAVAFKQCMTDEFRKYAADVIVNAKALADALAGLGWRIVSGGTDNHLMLVDLRSRMPDTTGRDAAMRLATAGIIANWNTIPNDPRPPLKASGIRLGTPALTTRGMGVEQMKRVAAWIDEVLRAEDDSPVIARTRSAVGELCKSFPVPWD
jgi:glycine hydroxymethyltransferase